MSQNLNPRRLPINRRIKPPHPSLSGHKLHRQVVVRSSKKQSKFIKRCHSEPTLLTTVFVGDDHQDMTPPACESSLLFRTGAPTNIFSSSPELLPYSPGKNESYNKDAKVVIKVTVEGSVGPIQALVKLGSSVDEAIKLVTNKYNAERRSPRLDQDDMTNFELHHSYFSLHSLDKSNMIGDIGSRSFYLRKSVKDNGAMRSSTFVGSEMTAKADEVTSPFMNIFFLGFIRHGFRKMIKKTRKIRRLLGCFGG
ncbi:uncharacterized protein At4g22758-like [Bidens hawaiensis]|uniref:uncharacterized protein At4g22758-like n=1 Tax=Bidens hawaiensis TaxID=980011 RepID=UPI00404ACB36